MEKCLYCGGDSALLINGIAICSACDDDFGAEVRESGIHLVAASEEVGEPLVSNEPATPIHSAR